MQKIVIRQFTKKDRDFVRYLCCETAFNGRPAENFFEGRNILADVLTRYFTDFEPESLFIAEIDGISVGYLTGNKDIKRQKKIFKTKVLPQVIIKILFTGSIFKRKNLIFALSCAKSFFKKEFFYPDFSGQFPSTLHINIDARYRSMGVGEKLMEHYDDFLRRENIKGIFVTTISERAKKFFQRLGFIILDRRKISYYSHLTDEDFFRYTLGKKLF
ncbi:MAG: GNAT family N-acetyltransferase [bacterium]|nr:GNAT family N-acetyltransferase [bacterium]